jgi:hypothetical protein|tara:strand:+ start:487 stop:705 length:219 start_codon:yes stop_codon:yes gene_type:complete
MHDETGANVPTSDFEEIKENFKALRDILDRSYINQSAQSVQERKQRAGPSETEGAGLKIFKNGVDYARENLL